MSVVTRVSLLGRLSQFVPEPARAKARKPARAVGFGAITAALGIGYRTADALAARRHETDESRGKLRDEWTARWSKALLGLFAVTVHLDKLPPAKDPTRGRLVVANHRSTIDIAVLLSTFGGHMVSRADLGEWPILGRAAKSVGTLFVDRTRASSGAELIRDMRSRLKQGATLCIFPEGTTFAGDEVRPFLPGAFAAAYKTGCEILPVGLAYQTGSGAAFTDETILAHLSRMSGAPPTNVVAVLGDPIATSDRATKDLLSESHAAVSKCTMKARLLVDENAVAKQDGLGSAGEARNRTQVTQVR